MLPWVTGCTMMYLEREFQLERNGTWDKGKGCDTLSVWPVLATADEIEDRHNPATLAAPPNSMATANMAYHQQLLYI